MMYLMLIFFTFFLYFKWKYSYWSRKKIDFIPPDLVFGNIGPFILGQKSIGDQITSLYRQFRQKNLKHGGIYLIHQPVYVPLDLNIVQSILQTDFKHFMNHGIFVDEKVDPLTGHLFALEDERWRSMRKKLSPAFTPAKIKMIFSSMLACTESLKSSFNKHTETSEPIHVKSAIIQFTVEVITCTAFGIDYKTARNPKSCFKKFSKMFLEDITCGTIMKFICSLLLPTSLLKLYGYKQTRQDIEDCFMEVVQTAIEYRKQKNICKKDFLQMLLETGTEDRESLSIEEISAQCFLFFIAGFEPPFIALTFALLELALNSKCQEILRNEILEIIKSNEGEITYEAVMQMKYLDKVVNETLRKHPPGAGTIRVCNKDYPVPGTNIVLSKGTRVHIPIQGIHKDPEYYLNPEIFDPERFNSENIAQRHPSAFLAFSNGPRMCLGSHLGLIQIKLGLITILKDFRLVLPSNATVSEKYSPRSFSTWPYEELWLRVLDCS